MRDRTSRRIHARSVGPHATTSTGWFHIRALVGHASNCARFAVGLRGVGAACAPLVPPSSAPSVHLAGAVEPTDLPIADVPSRAERPRTGYIPSPAAAPLPSAAAPVPQNLCELPLDFPCGHTITKQQHMSVYYSILNNTVPVPVADFSLSVTPSAVTLAKGSSTQVSVSVSGSSGFASSVSVQASGLPTGVTISPSSIAVQMGSPQTFSLSAGNSASPASNVVTVTGSAGSITHSTQLSLTVNAPVFTPSRTAYVRSDAATQYFQYLNSHWAVFNPNSNRFFVTDPVGNHVFVFDASTRMMIATLDVPGAFSLDDSPDHTILYIGTQIGDLYTVDPVAMSITKRYPAAEISPYGFQTYAVLGLADGRLALLGSQGGIQNIDGYSDFAIWNPADNSISVYASVRNAAGLYKYPTTIVCGPLINIGGFARTADRRKIVVSSVDSDGTLCLVDPSTGASTYTTQPTVQPTPSPDGNYIAISTYPPAIVLLDAHTLGLVAQFPVSGFSAPSLAFSVDSKTVFAFSASIVYAYDVGTRQQIGWTPNLFLPPTSGGMSVGAGEATAPIIQATDNTGLQFGAMEEGVGFLDTAALRTGAVGTQFTNGYLKPSSGAVAGGTAVTLTGGIPSGSKVDSVYFGSQNLASFTISGNSITMIAPPGPPGPADVRIMMSDGGVMLIPEGFSYGPTILQVTPNTSTADGGGTGIIYGYGFGSFTDNAIPSDLEITVGGQRAKILSYIGNAYGLLSLPFELESVAFTIPAGVAGAPADVTVTNNSGSATLHSGMSYLPPPQVFTLPGASMQQGIYDPHRDLYYLTDANKIQVFSRTKGQWLPPISIPSPIAGAAQRLWAISLSLDGSKLAVSDNVANVIYVIDPDQVTPLKAFPITSPMSGITRSPAGIAVSNKGTIYYAASNFGGTGFSSYFKLDSNTGQVTDYNVTGPGLGTKDAYLRTVLSADGARVYFNNDGRAFSIDTVTDKIFYSANGPGCCYGDYDLTLSSNQSRLAATSYLYDADLNGESYIALNDREFMNISYAYGMKLSADGSLLFQPSTSGIDVFDGRVGTLWTRISLPLSLSTGFDALVSNGRDNVLLAITNVLGGNANAIAILDLSSVPEPKPLPYATKTPAARMTSLKPATPGFPGIGSSELLPRTPHRVISGDAVGQRSTSQRQ